MAQRIDTKELGKITTFDELTEKKKQLEREVEEVGTKVTKSTSDLLKQGAKVAAAGAAAVIISKMVGAFMRARKEDEEDAPEEGPKEGTKGTPQEPSEKAQSFEAEEAEEPLAVKVRTLLMWLDALVKGIETAKILIHEFRASRAETEEHVEEVVVTDEEE